MSTLIISEDEIRKAVSNYYNNYESEIYKKFNFGDSVFGIDGDTISMELESL